MFLSRRVKWGKQWFKQKKEGGAPHKPAEILLIGIPANGWCVCDEVKGSKRSDKHPGLCVCVRDETGQSRVATITASVCVCVIRGQSGVITITASVHAHVWGWVGVMS